MKINFQKRTVIEWPRETQRKRDIGIFDCSIRVMNNHAGSTLIRPAQEPITRSFHESTFARIFLFLTSGDAKRWNEVFMGTPICKCVTHSLRCRHWNGWNGNRAVRARRHIERETAYHQITQKQRTFVAIQYNKYLGSQNIYLFK